jgi:isochorismate synthase
MNNQEKAITLEPDLGSFTKEELIRAALQWAGKQGLPVALWRRPFQSEVNLLLSFEAAKEVTQYDIQELSNGFAFAPFSFGEEKGLFISGDILLSFDFNETVFTPLNKERGSEQIQKFKVQLIEQLEASRTNSELPLNGGMSLTEPSSPSDYEHLVERCIEAIQAGTFEKIVPARSKDIALPENFDLVAFFNGLCQAYQNAFISYVSIPQAGSWLGATPEVLIEKETQVFRTIALAATQRYNPDASLTDTAWTQKEIEEQAMVSRYIINCFKKIRLREFSEKGPETVKAGNLLHLKTTFEVDLQATNFQELPTVMLELLHPTSAVAGMPKEETLAFLKVHEKLNRRFYSGFLGPVNIEDCTHLYVNLRCMELAGSHGRLFAGAGVTAHSRPQKELAETEMKFNTLLNILNQSH